MKKSKVFLPVGLAILLTAAGVWLYSDMSRALQTIPILSIPVIELKIPVKTGADIQQTMDQGFAARFWGEWDGNVGLCAHNDGAFKRLYQLKPGDLLSYTAEIGQRTYQVESTRIINEMDWSPLSLQGNRLTLITGIEGQPSLRLCVGAAEITTAPSLHQTPY